MTPAAATASAAQWTTTHPLTSPGGRCCLACRSGRRVKCTPAPDQSETGASAAMLRRASTCCMTLSTCDSMAPPSASNGCAPPSLRLRPEVPFVQQVKPDNKPIGNSQNGRYSVPRPRAAGKSGSVNRSVASAGRAAKARKALAQPMRRSPATPRTSQRQAKSTAGSSRCVCGPGTNRPVTTGRLAPRHPVAIRCCLAAGPPRTRALLMTTPSGSTICTTPGGSAMSIISGAKRMRTAQSCAQTPTTAMTAGEQHGEKCKSN